jgi:hypothetical protein
MQGHLKINIDLFSALCPPQLHKTFKSKNTLNVNLNVNESSLITNTVPRMLLLELYS